MTEAVVTGDCIYRDHRNLCGPILGGAEEMVFKDLGDRVDFNSMCKPGVTPDSHCFLKNSGGYEAAIDARRKAFETCSR